VASFTVAVTFSTLGIGLMGGGVVALLQALGLDVPGEALQWGTETLELGPVAALLRSIGAIGLGILVLTALLHLARVTGRAHGRFAKLMLVAA
jgi:hypothetical protein